MTDASPTIDLVAAFAANKAEARKGEPIRQAIRRRLQERLRWLYAEVAIIHKVDIDHDLLCVLDNAACDVAEQWSRHFQPETSRKTIWDRCNAVSDAYWRDALDIEIFRDKWEPETHRLWAMREHIQAVTEATVDEVVGYR